jgi:drug/metabolite transporter (DMT)-like permease
MLSDLIDAVSQTFLKKAVNFLDAEVNSVKKALVFVLSLVRLKLVWFSFALSIISLAIWFLVLTRAELSFAYSVDSMRYIFVALASLFFLKERIGPLRWLGIGSIVCGILIVSIS